MRQLALSLFLVLPLVSLGPPGLAATDAAGEDPVARAIADPPTTGLLVTRVLDGSQAEKSGVKRGDVITRYGGEATPDLPALNGAKNAARGQKSVGMSVFRSGLEISIFLSPGTIGVQLIPVEKGVGRRPLPTDTGVTFDFSSLANQPRDDWYAVFRGEEKIGLGRITAQRLGPDVFVLTEEILDLPTTLEDHEVTSVFQTVSAPLARMTIYRDRMNDWVRYGHRGEGEEPVFSVLTRGPGSDGRADCRSLPARLVPVYAMETIAAFMPREKGACFRFVPVYEGSGEFLQESALVCEGPQEIERHGEKVKAWRYEWRQLDGGVNGIYFVGDEGRVLRTVLGEIHAERMPEPQAIRGQPDSVRSRLRQ